MFGFGKSKLEKYVINNADEAFTKWLQNYVSEKGIPDISSILSSHRRILNSSWSEYKKIKRTGAFHGLEKALNASEVEWYTEEIGQRNKILVVPVSAVKSQAIMHVHEYFMTKIAAFRQLPKDDGSRRVVAFGAAFEAVQNEFLWAIKKGISEGVAICYHKLIRMQQNDLYHFGQDTMTRAPTLIFEWKIYDEYNWAYDHKDRPIDRNFSPEQYQKWVTELEFDGGYASLQRKNE